MSSVLGIDQGMIVETTSFGVIEAWDSMNHMLLMLALEEEFGIEFSDEELGSLKDFKSIYLALVEKNDPVKPE